MRHSFLSIQWVLLLALMLTGSLLSGCIKTTPIPTRFYVLTPLDHPVSLVSETDQKIPLSVEISSLRLPQYLEKPQIVTRSSGNRLELAEYDQWGGNLRKNMIRVLAQNLSRLLSTSDISIAPFRPPTPPNVGVELEVMQFEKNAGGQVRLSVQWRLLDGKDNQTLKSRMTDLVSPVDHTPPNFEHTVSVMSALLGELSHIIGKEILHLVAEGPAQ
jgi:hypothetical protein